MNSKSPKLLRILKDKQDTENMLSTSTISNKEIDNYVFDDDDYEDEDDSIEFYETIAGNIGVDLNKHDRENKKSFTKLKFLKIKNNTSKRITLVPVQKNTISYSETGKELESFEIEPAESLTNLFYLPVSHFELFDQENSYILYNFSMKSEKLTLTLFENEGQISFAIDDGEVEISVASLIVKNNLIPDDGYIELK